MPSRRKGTRPSRRLLSGRRITAPIGASVHICLSAKERRMDFAVTAIYRSHAMARLVRNELERAGIGRDRITVLPGARIVSNDAEADDSAPTPDSIEDALLRLEDLPLPDSDAGAVREALRNGGFLVCVSLADESDLDQVTELMDRPGEAYGEDQSDATRPEPAAVPADGRWAALPAGGL